MLEIDIDVEKLIKSLDLSRKRFGTNLEDAMDNIVDDGKEIMKQEAPEGTGELRKNIIVDVKKEKGNVIGIITANVGYAEAIEYGRPAGGDAPVSKIQKWLLAKGLPVRYAGQISKTIGKGKSKSNQPNPFVERTFNKLKKIVDKEINTAIFKAKGFFR